MLWTKCSVVVSASHDLMSACRVLCLYFVARVRRRGNARKGRRLAFVFMFFLTKLVVSLPSLVPVIVYQLFEIGEMLS